MRYIVLKSTRVFCVYSVYDTTTKRKTMFNATLPQTIDEARQNNYTCGCFYDDLNAVRRNFGDFEIMFETNDLDELKEKYPEEFI